MINYLLANIHAIVVVFGIFGFIFCWVRDHKNKQKTSLDSLVPKAFSASLIPSGIIMIVCAFKPDIIIHLSGLNIYIAAAGLVLIYIAITTIIKE